MTSPATAYDLTLKDLCLQVEKSLTVADEALVKGKWKVAQQICTQNLIRVVLSVAVQLERIADVPARKNL